ncbi:YpfB family protein [Neobacillus sp. LXY-4]|uniref:YpfB family protein n=1 Tax=Neobacillus sp. LXY-4 TaxID=3379826 RepID=UPI003EDF72FE
MKTFERILMKIVLIQFIILVFSQFFFHKIEVLPELQQLARYEGVTEDNFSQILETFNGR